MGHQDWEAEGAPEDEGLIPVQGEDIAASQSSKAESKGITQGPGANGEIAQGQSQRAGDESKQAEGQGAGVRLVAGCFAQSIICGLRRCTPSLARSWGSSLVHAVDSSSRAVC